MSEKKRLGRGLAAILSESRTPEDKPSVIEIALDLISPNSQQPRQRFDRAKLQDLAQSIQENGVVQPIIVRTIPNGYEIVVGERRWRAAQMAGLKNIPVIIRDVSDSDLLATALIENVQRDDLNPLEIASAFDKLITDAGLSHAQVASRVAMDRSTVTNYLRLLALPDSIKRDLLEDSLSMGHARALLAVKNPKAQRDIADAIIKRGLSVRQVETAVKRISSPPKRKDTLPANVASVQEDLSSLLGTKVTITINRGGGGKLLIDYYSSDDLERLITILRG